MTCGNSCNSSWIWVILIILVILFAGNGFCCNNGCSTGCNTGCC